MDSAVLVGTPVEGGRRLVAELDKISFDVSAALWFYVSDENRWKLIIASTAIEHKDPRDAYKKVSRIIRTHPDFGVSSDDIVLTSPSDELIRLLRTAIRTGPEISEIRFTRNVINNVPIDDAIIYRM